MNNEPDPSLGFENYFPVPPVISTPLPPNPYYRMWDDIMGREVQQNLNQAIETLAAYARQHLPKGYMISLDCTAHSHGIQLALFEEGDHAGQTIPIGLETTWAEAIQKTKTQCNS